MSKLKTFFSKIGPFFTAARLRIASESPKFFKTINALANAVLTFAVGFQPDVLEFANSWLSTGLHPLPWLSTVSSTLAGIGLGAKLVAKMTANLAKLTENQIEKINPTQPEIAEAIKP